MEEQTSAGKELAESPGWRDAISHTHAHCNALNENHSNQPPPNHPGRASISHAIVKGTCERRKQSEDGEADTEGSP